MTDAIATPASTESLLAEPHKLLDQLKQELALAAEFQRSILPPIKETTYLRVAARYEPHSGVSGDMYRWFYNREGEYNFFLGDATGHGLTAAFITMMVHMSLSNTRGDLPPDEVMSRLNGQLTALQLDGKFISGLFFRIQPSGDLLLSSAGHPPAVILRRNDAEPEFVGSSGLPLGWFPDPPERYGQEISRLEKGDRVFVYTDGITEWAAPDGRQFGRERLLAYLTENRSARVDQVLDGLVDAARGYCEDAPSGDDLTVFGFEFRGV